VQHDTRREGKARVQLIQLLAIQGQLPTMLVSSLFRGSESLFSIRWLYNGSGWLRALHCRDRLSSSRRQGRGLSPEGRLDLLERINRESRKTRHWLRLDRRLRLPRLGRYRSRRDRLWSLHRHIDVAEDAAKYLLRQCGLNDGRRWQTGRPDSLLPTLLHLLLDQPIVERRDDVDILTGRTRSADTTLVMTRDAGAVVKHWPQAVTTMRSRVVWQSFAREQLAAVDGLSHGLWFGGGRGLVFGERRVVQDRQTGPDQDT